MKRIFFVLLLIVFSAQGITVATGGSGMGARIVAQDIAAQDIGGDDAADIDDLNSVAADMEEMSDYVAHESAAHAIDRRVTPVRATMPPLVSIDLPRAPPPPRA